MCPNDAPLDDVGVLSDDEVGRFLETDYPWEDTFEVRFHASLRVPVRRDYGAQSRAHRSRSVQCYPDRMTSVSVPYSPEQMLTE